MFDPTMSFEKGRESIGENAKEFTFEFTKDDRYLRASRQAAEAYARGELRDSAVSTEWLQAWQECPLQECMTQNDLSDEYERIVEEMLTNAFEHGSQWCEAGPVVVRIFLQETDHKFLLTIDQPLSGFDTANIMSHTRYEVDAVTRGGGLDTVKNEREKSTVGYETIDSGQYKFRTLIFDCLPREAK